MKESDLIQQAKSCIKDVRGKTLNEIERIKRSIELAALMIKEADRIQTPKEKKHQAQLAAMMRDPIGKVFTNSFTDECFRSHRPERIADQLIYLIKEMGIPHYLPWSKRILLKIFTLLGKPFAKLTVLLVIKMLRKETSTVILPGESKPLSRHMRKRIKEGVRVNLNHLGEAILGEEEAENRLKTYLEDLAKPEVEYISVKISTLYSQINLLGWEETLHILAKKLRILYRAAMKEHFVRPDGTKVPKFVNLDMEEYRDLHLTVDLFRLVLTEPEFYTHEAGIVLQSYLPDSFPIQQELTEWAMHRLARGGAPIKIRIVKGANLAMEQVESALRLWPQAPYPTKHEVDAKFIKMVQYGCQKEHAEAVHLGIGSHNIFDIAFTLLLRAENKIENKVVFEMLEGMADHMRRVVQQISGGMLLYCPAATRSEFQNAIAYLMRRLDENTGPENFLRQAFDLKPETESWHTQAKFFSDSVHEANEVSNSPRRTQNREKETYSSTKKFTNEPDTDWSLPNNRQWGQQIILNWKDKIYPSIPLVIGGKEIHTNESFGIDPSYPDKKLYRYAKATEQEANQAIEIAKKSETNSSLEERTVLLSNIANELRKNRGELIGAMVANTGKTVAEADVEVSEAIDFAKYYRFNLQEWFSLNDIKWQPKGTILIAPPWNFPCSIPAGGILAALAGGNSVIFKPPPESVLVAWILVQLFWKAGVSKNVLQFLPCDDEPVGSSLIKDERINAIILTGATSTAKLFMNMRPGLDLMAETGGKNTIVITGMADRDLAIKDLIQSAFGHAGQKCSACSLAILEAEVYDDPHFLNQLRDAAKSLPIGSPWNLNTKMNPLIRAPNSVLLQGLTHLEPGETWLLEPKQDPSNPQLWSPGIKLGVKPSSFTFQNELFGPVLGIVRADNLQHAFHLMNQTPYGLTAGIHTLDEREQHEWLDKIEAGNCYINRTITGAIVQRQPFGGCKESSFGKGAKAGGPNYLVQMMQPIQTALPQERSLPNEKVKALTFVGSELELWEASVGSYAYHWEHYFSKMHDPSQVRGQDNFLRYTPHSHLVLRGQKGDSFLDLLRFSAAALTCGASFEVSVDEGVISNPHSFIIESDDAFAKRIEKDKMKRIRLLQAPSSVILQAAAQAPAYLDIGPILANGRLELLHFLREVAISRDYHRYGNLGKKEKECEKSFSAKSFPI